MKSSSVGCRRGIKREARLRKAIALYLRSYVSRVFDPTCRMLIYWCKLFHSVQLLNTFE
ncbi:hypothetical protein [Kamptonema sp. UHCC 0994]|uniref:hypothetical protein n=1 Tax=Kamptonema sp. UHCC 0994 TaxID=3031329 RepID=UPI0023B9EFD4|nr:hypothetical protein [Kamptonema sp. UHCC 0994]MDF0552000.1 hypothetical protein [Kamptonema sp. UHCC 0994]